jgi:hypothetical protein
MMEEHTRNRDHVGSAMPAEKHAPGVARPPEPSVQECCDRCGSVRLIRVKACWRCEACGYKSDCNGW